MTVKTKIEKSASLSIKKKLDAEKTKISSFEEGKKLKLFGNYSKRIRNRIIGLLVKKYKK
jgi:ribosomal protein S17E